MKSIISFTVSMVIFATIGGIVRFIELPSSEIAFFRGLIGVVFLLPFLLINKTRSLAKNISENIMVLFFTGAALAGNWILLLNAFRHTTIALAAVSYYTAPVIAMVLSIFILKERVSLLKMAAICLTLTGMFLVMNIGGGDISSEKNITGILYGLSAAFCYAMVMLLNKFIRNLDGLETTIPQLFFATVVLFIYTLLSGEMEPVFQSDLSFVLLIVLGIVHTGIGFLLYFTGMKGIKTQDIAVLSYIDPLVSVLISLFIFNESMSAMQISGAILIGSTTLLNTVNWRELRRFMEMNFRLYGK